MYQFIKNSWCSARTRNPTRIRGIQQRQCEEPAHFQLHSRAVFNSRLCECRKTTRHPRLCHCPRRARADIIIIIQVRRPTRWLSFNCYFGSSRLSFPFFFLSCLSLSGSVQRKNLQSCLFCEIAGVRRGSFFLYPYSRILAAMGCEKDVPVTEKKLARWVCVTRLILLFTGWLDWVSGMLTLSDFIK